MAGAGGSSSGGSAGTGAAGTRGGSGGSAAGAGGAGGGSAGASGLAGAVGSAGAGGGAPGAGGGTAGAGGSTGGTGGSTTIAGPLVFDVSAATNPVVPGNRLLYTITVGNISSTAVAGVGIVLRVPTGLQFTYNIDANPAAGGCQICAANAEAQWNLGTIPAGATTSIAVNASVLTTIGDGDSITTPVTLTATGVNPIIVNKTVQVFGHPSAQLALGTAYSPVTPGQAFTLDFDVGQIGTVALADTELHASLPAGVTIGAISDGGTQSTNGDIVWTIGSLPVGAAFHRSITLSANATVPAGSVLVSHATLIFDGGLAADGGAAVNATADLPVAVVGVAPPLSVDVGVALSPAIPGSRLLYTATISNVSARAVDAVSLLLRVPAGLQFTYNIDANPTANGCQICGATAESYWNIGTIAAGASATITLNASVVATAVGDGSLISAPIKVTATGVNEINLNKTVQVFSHPGAQLALGTVTNPVTSGQAFMLNIDVGQIGASALTGTQLTLSLPPNVTVGTISDGGSQGGSGGVAWSIGTLAVGATLHRTVALTVGANVVSGTVLAARAFLTYDGGDPVDALADYSVPVAPAAPPITIGIVATPSPIMPGTRLLYTTTITNTAARAIAGVQVVFRVPFAETFTYNVDANPVANGCQICSAGAEAYWNLGTLAAGGSQIISVNALVASTLLGGSLIPASTELTATGLTNPIWVQTTIPTN